MAPLELGLFYSGRSVPRDGQGQRGGGPSPSSCPLFSFWEGVGFTFYIRVLFSQPPTQALSVLSSF